MSTISYLKKIHPQYVFKITPPTPRKNSCLYIINGEQTTDFEITGAREPFARTEALISHRNEPLIQNFNLPSLEAIFAQLHCHNYELEAAPTHTKNKWP